MNGVAALTQLNSDPPEIAHAAFLRCCGSTIWAKGMAQGRPYESLEEVQKKAQQLWSNLSENDWLEAFLAHPRIGARGKVSAWSEAEQSGMSKADPQEVDALAKLNDQYFEKFGFVFLICATGKSPGEMLTALQQRLGNDRARELGNAGAEQAKITALRLEKLLC